MLGRVREYRRVMRASRLLGKGERLNRRGKLAQARVALLEGLSTLDGIGSGMFAGLGASVRLSLDVALSRIAAGLQDSPEAARYARDGLALWAELRLSAPRTSDARSFVEWEAWARAFLRALPEAPPAPAVSLELLEAGPGCPLLRFTGRDAGAVRALREALGRVPAGQLALHAVPGIGAAGGCHLTAALARRDRGVRRLARSSFLWEASRTGWAQVIGLLEPFEAQEPGEERSQLLSSKGAVRVLISTDGSG